MSNQWKPDFKKWYNVDKEVYKVAFEQGEKRLEDILSESESITNKAIKMIAAVVAMFAFFVSFLVKNQIPIGYNVVFMGIFIINVVTILWLIFPKRIKNRGIEPKVFFAKDFDNEEDKAFQQQLLYYSGVVILQNNIDFMIARNEVRAKVYLACSIMALLLLIAGSTLIISSL